jgi:hypothetical protein
MTKIAVIILAATLIPAFEGIVDITEIPQELRGKWCVDTLPPKGSTGTLYRPCGGEKPDVSISARLAVPRSGERCAFSNGLQASDQPLYLIEIACSQGRLVYWMARKNELLIVKPARMEDLPGKKLGD